jgi:hypothetical protein
VRSAKRVLSDLTMPGPDAIRADARQFHQMVGSDTLKARTATLFAQGLQTRGPLELDLGDRIGSPMTEGRRPGRRQSAHLTHKQLSYGLCSNASSGRCTPTTTSP